MRRFWLVAFAVLALGLVSGCGPAEPEGRMEERPVAGEEQAGAAAATGGGGGVQVTPSAAGGLAPVTGTESLQGGGSGVGQAAKDMARDVAGSAGSGSAGALETAEGE